MAKHLYIGGKPEEKVLEQVLEMIVAIQELNRKGDKFIT